MQIASGGEANRAVIEMLKSRRRARNEMRNANHLHFSSAILFMTELAISHEIQLLLSEEARECRCRLELFAFVTKVTQKCVTAYFLLFYRNVLLFILGNAYGVWQMIHKK